MSSDDEAEQTVPHPNLFFRKDRPRHPPSSEHYALNMANKILNNMYAPGVLDEHGACYYNTGPELEAY